MRISITRSFRMISTGFWHARMRLVSLISLPSASSLALLMRQKRLQRRMTMSGFRLAFTRMKLKMNQTQRMQDAIREAANHPKCVAIGEAGLDYFYDYATPQQQAESFRAQIAVARELDLPIIVHARDADDDMAAILEDEMEKGAFRGVLHCFSSGADLAQRAVAIGFYISFSGILTFNKADKLREIAAEMPEDRILVETDSPYLAPAPHRGRPNEPAYTAHTLAKLAAVRGLQVADMAAITRANTLRLFNRMVLS